MDSIDIRYMTDTKSNQYYPITHVEAVEGLDSEGNFEALQDIINDVDSMGDNYSNIQTDLTRLENMIKAIQVPTVTDTGWVNMILKPGITSFSSSETPQARLMSMNGIYFLSLRGAVKGATGKGVVVSIPYSMSFAIKKSIPFSQNTSFISNLANFISLRIETNGDINLKGSTQNPIADSHWIPMDITVML